jgi:hypothetical protein
LQLYGVTGPDGDLVVGVLRFVPLPWVRVNCVSPAGSRGRSRNHWVVPGIWDTGRVPRRLDDAVTLVVGLHAVPSMMMGLERATRGMLAEMGRRFNRAVAMGSSL